MVVDALAAAMDLLGLARDGAVVAREPSGSIGDPSSQGYLAHGGGSPGVGDLLRVPLWAATPTSGQERPGGIMPSVKLPPPQKNRPHLGECQIYFSIIQRKVLTPNDFANVDAIRLRLALYEQLDFIRNKDFATVSVAACGSEHEDCVIHKPLPWPNPRLRLWCSVRHLSQCGSVSRRRGHARH